MRYIANTEASLRLELFTGSTVAYDRTEKNGARDGKVCGGMALALALALALFNEDSKQRNTTNDVATIPGKDIIFMIVYAVRPRKSARKTKGQQQKSSLHCGKKNNCKRIWIWIIKSHDN